MSKTYITAQGDTWDYIAYTQLGSGWLAHKLHECNFYLLDYIVFPAGIKVHIPDVDDDEADSTQDSLPPWRRS